jgi:hypothetical protein
MVEDLMFPLFIHVSIQFFSPTKHEKVKMSKIPPLFISGNTLSCAVIKIPPNSGLSVEY